MASLAQGDSLAVNRDPHFDGRRTKALGLHPNFKSQLIAWAIALGLYAIVVPTGWVSSSTAEAINNIGWTLASLLALLSCGRAARILTGRDRTAWLLFTAATGSWAFGQLIWTLQALVLDGPLAPRIADISYLGFPPLMIAGLFVLRSTQKERGWTWLRVANLSLVLCSLAIVLIAMLSGPFVHPSTPAAVSLFVIAQNALTTIAFIVAIYFLWSYQWGTRSISTVLIAAGLATQMITALFYTRTLVSAEYAATSFLNIGWMIGFALQQWAAEVLTKRNDGTLVSERTIMGQGWIEALAPALLVLCIAVTTLALAEEMTPRILNFASTIAIAFALVLAVREGWLYHQGLKLQLQLEHTGAELTQARTQLQAMHVEHDALESNVQLMARAGVVGLWDWDMLKGQVHFSPEWKRQLGYEEHEISDDLNEWNSRIHPDDLPNMNQSIEHFFDEPTGQWSHEIRLRHRDGSYRWLLSQASASLDEAGNPVRILGSHVDITRLKELEFSLRESESRYRELVENLEERVKERTNELAEAYQESQSFAYAVAHDLKAPLRAIDGFSALLTESASGRMSETELGHLARVRRGAIHMAELIDGLLAYSRLEHQEMRIKAVDCRALVAELLSTMADEMQKAHVQLVNSVEPTPVLADVEGLRIVLRNLLDNALKFSRSSNPPRIEVSSKSDGRGFVLCVKDNGIGFDPQYLDKIFEIFNRLHARGYEGTGIGLALARKAMQRMRGRIWAESTLGKGATFYASLPHSGLPVPDLEN